LFKTEESNNPSLTDGTKFFGKSVDEKTKIDSIFSTTMTEEKKANIASCNGINDESNQISKKKN